NYANRHNSYFVWFRVEDQQLQFYKVVNDTFTLKNTVSNIVTNINQWYDFKITYDRTTGRIAVWRDNVYLGSWTDPSPYSTNGNYISFRTGNAVLNVDELKVYRSRYSQVTVTVGDSSKDIRYQNPNSTTYGAKIKSIVVDANNNLSAIEYHDLNVDWTPPTYNATIQDGIATDVDTITTLNNIAANWLAFTDNNSGIKEYWYSVGTSVGDSNVVNWTNVQLNNNFTTNITLTPGFTYYVNVRAVNHAGIKSNIYTSDGALYLPNGNLPLAQFSSSTTEACSGTPIQFTNQSIASDSVHWIFNGAVPNNSNQPNPTVIYNNAGTYDVTLIAFNSNGSDTLTQSGFINIWQAPVIQIQTNVINSQAPYYVVFNNQSQYVDNSFWDFGDGQTANDFAPYHQYNQDGIYIYTYTATNAHCTSTYSDTILLGVSEITPNPNNCIYVYPNPTQKYLVVESTSLTIDAISVYGIDGKEFIQEKIFNSKNYIYVDNLENGIYFISIKLLNGNAYNYKFVKQ
ncbi:MAG: T9SS type A sorting domain-containing protein, partial [Bacteroidales bacterium]|nr:T9SS type A sorting domain-containing protein [Bacteroidales bacterium]